MPVFPVAICSQAPLEGSANRTDPYLLGGMQPSSLGTFFDDNDINFRCMFWSKNSFVNLTIAINYGGRDEVARATKRMAQDVAKGFLNPETVNEQTLAGYLDTYVLPDPDLVIRTSGEARISNFLLWQSAYSEYEFVKTLWPDFTVQDFQKIVAIFASKERRFGGLLAS